MFVTIVTDNFIVLFLLQTVLRGVGGRIYNQVVYKFVK